MVYTIVAVSITWLVSVGIARGLLYWIDGK